MNRQPSIMSPTRSARTDTDLIFRFVLSVPVAALFALLLSVPKQSYSLKRPGETTSFNAQTVSHFLLFIRAFFFGKTYDAAHRLSLHCIHFILI